MLLLVCMLLLWELCQTDDLFPTCSVFSLLQGSEGFSLLYSLVFFVSLAVRRCVVVQCCLRDPR